MKYEVILKVKHNSSSSFEQAGRIVVSPEHLKAQEDAYSSRAKKMDIFDHVILINELDDDGEPHQLPVDSKRARTSSLR